MVPYDVRVSNLVPVRPARCSTHASSGVATASRHVVTSSGFEIREARPSEHAAVGELTVAAYLADGLVGDDYLAVLRDASSRAALGLLLVAADVTTQELLGTASLFTTRAGPRWAEGASAGDAVLRMLAVSPWARRLGVARALTLECVRRAREMGLERLLLSTAPAMRAAQGLYGQLGFRRDPGADWEPVPGVTLLAYWLPLADRGGRIGPGSVAPHEGD